MDAQLFAVVARALLAVAPLALMVALAVTGIGIIVYGLADILNNPDGHVRRTARHTNRHHKGR